MRIAICVSGLARSGRPERDITLNLDSVKRAFPTADVFLGTWSNHVKHVSNLFPGHYVLSIDEPKLDYHPYIDAPDDVVRTDKLRKMIRQSHNDAMLRERYSHQTKQIIAHAEMVRSLPSVYDVVVRVRYDTYVSQKADFTEYVHASVLERKAFGFAWMQGMTDFDESKPIERDSQYRERFLFDQLIIHRGDMLDPSFVRALSNNGKLLPAEFGWWQVLSEPYGDNHTCVCGWANPDKNVDTRYFT